MKKVALVTGASSGIGKETAKLLAQNNYKVYAVARRLENMKDLEKLGINILSMDITSDDSMVNGINQIFSESGKIDILVNSAGFGSHGAIEDVSIQDARY